MKMKDHYYDYDYDCPYFEFFLTVLFFAGLEVIEWAFFDLFLTIGAGGNKWLRVLSVTS